MRRLVIGIVAVVMCAGMVLLRASAGAVPQIAAASAPAIAVGSATVPEGERLFQQNCSYCHIPTAQADRAYALKLHKGVVADPVKTREVILKGRLLMPGFQHALDAAQVEAVLGYLATVDAVAPPLPPGPRRSVSHVMSPGRRTLLTGTIKSSAGEGMEGVTVSAKADDGTITTSVFTDKQGNYYFPAMEGGTYRVWAQAIGFEAGRAQVALTAVPQRQDFRMKETTDFVRQLTGGQFVAALPLDTPNRRRMRDIFVHNCTTCHTAGIALQNRFDEAGWNAIIASMVRSSGTAVQGRPIPHLSHFQKELAAYLAEMRGPGPSPMQLKVPPRPTGAATLPVVYVYDVPLEEYGGYHAVHDGSDWSLGTPSNSYGVRNMHDASIDFAGNIWFTHLPVSRTRTYGRIDTKTGEVTTFRVPGRRSGFAATSHGIMRNPDGNMWINVTGSAGAGITGEGVPGSLGRIDVKTGKIDVFTPPAGVPGVGGHVDWDGKGFIWASSEDGAVRFDPRTGAWTSFKSLTKENSSTYGVAADRHGNGWWAEINIDKVGYTDGSGQTKELSLPKNAHISELTVEDRLFYEATGSTASNRPPWAQGPRRLSTDKLGDDIWFGLFAGSNLMRLNSRTMEQKIYRIPGTGVGAYMPTIDSNHNVWLDVQGDDTVNLFNPQTEQWTVYHWPIRGAAPRHLSVSDRNGVVEVVTALWGVGKAGRMVIRTERDLQALRSQGQSAAR